MTMPPFGMWIRGGADIIRFMQEPGPSLCKARYWSPRARSTASRHGGSTSRTRTAVSPWALLVREPSGDRFERLTFFLDTKAIFPRSGSRRTCHKRVRPMTGFGGARLRRVRDVLARHVELGAAPGAVALLARGGETVVEAVGDYGRDTIFRIASMSKPVTAAAAMILVEECVLRLDDPVNGLLPELADRRVLMRVDGPLEYTVPAGGPSRSGTC